MIDVELPRLGRSQALFGQSSHLQHDEAARCAGAYLVADAQLMTCSRGLAVHLHPPSPTGFLGKRTRFEDTRGRQPTVEPHARNRRRLIHPATYS